VCGGNETDGMAARILGRHAAVTRRSAGVPQDRTGQLLAFQLICTQSRRRSLWSALDGAKSILRRCCRDGPRTGHRREYRHLQRGQFDPVAAAAASRLRPPGVRVRNQRRSTMEPCRPIGIAGRSMVGAPAVRAAIRNDEVSCVVWRGRLPASLKGVSALSWS
jgi:hypothetical protein